MTLANLEDQGITLTTEIKLSLEQFRVLLEAGLGVAVDDSCLLECYGDISGKVLPANPDSYWGVGGDINQILYDWLKEFRMRKEQIIEMIKRGVYVLVVQRSTGLAYTVSRNYGLVDTVIALPKEFEPQFIEKEDNHSFFCTPDWAREGDKCKEGFTAYWLY